MASIRSTGRAARSRPDRAVRSRLPLDVYLFPAAVGGGRGDIEEVLTVGRRLAEAGVSLWLYRARGRPLPRGVDKTFAAVPLRRVARLRPSAARALTVSPHFGTTAESARPGPLGHAGVWAEEREEVERAYGPGAVLHLSLEEFARARPLRWLAEERWREGGWTRSRIATRRKGPQAGRELAEFQALYRRFRALDRADLLTLFPGFLYSRAFASEFPETVQCGPIAPWPHRPRYREPGPARPLELLWYASPASSVRIASKVLAGLVATGRPSRLTLRTPRPMPLRPPRGVEVVEVPLSPSRAWARRWRTPHVVLTTGSRSLLEALSVGAPFLYFNGVLGRGGALRRHRPEKLDGLLRWLALERVPAVVRRDLSDLARGRRVAEVVARAVTDASWRAAFPPRRPGAGYAPGFEEGGTVAVAVARAFAEPSTTLAPFLAGVRAVSRARPARSKV